MVSKHFQKRWKERIESKNIPSNLLRNLWVRCFKVLEHNKGQDELVCVIDFNKYGYNFFENELWIIIRDRILVTMFRRNDKNPKSTYGSRVDNVSYVCNW